MKKKPEKSKKVIVALSGGVDSAVAAALLKKQGYGITAVYFLFFDGARAAEIQVKKIAKKLDIPLKIVDARKEFKKRVIDYFLDSYKKGLTPNPCVVCNKEMKFRMLFDLLKKYKSDFAATGHYARIFRGTRNTEHGTKKSYKLQKAKDKNKDQSYFLYRLTQNDLAKIMFPLGDYEKKEVRKLAEKTGLPIQRKESQDICFIENNDFGRFLKKNIKMLPGKVANRDGKTIGSHEGLAPYTFGQRRGIKIGPPASRREREALRAGGPGPYFVLQKNMRKNILVITNNPKDLLRKKFSLKKISWIAEKPEFPMKAQVQIRYHSEKFSAIIKKTKKGKIEITSAKNLRAVTAGQSAVFFRGSELLGGGVILPDYEVRIGH
ncbi:MAG: tRNA 2-thiouridine(34) synthase MnmA [Parcubacteria group bacterium]|jgi:tRNA-specific 2-thiouridylase